MLAQRSLVGSRRGVAAMPAAPLVPALAPGRLSMSRHSKAAPLLRCKRQTQVPVRYPGTTCFAAASSSGSTAEQQTSPEALSGLMVPTTGMSKGLGSFSGGATLQRSKLDQRQKTKSWEFKTDDSGGGGAGGKGIFNGGGGGDDGGDDDDYFDDGEGDEGGDGGDGGFFRMLIDENYSRAAIGAVLSEWYHTFETLPLILRQAAQMGLLSSAQLVRFCAMDSRPTVTRTVARSLPASLSRSLVGRMMADPAFVQKLLMESAITAGSSLFYEAQQRGDAFGRELDLVAVNTLSLMAANVALVWTLAPNRSFGNPRQMPWQRWMAALPNNIFDASSPQRHFSRASRVACPLTKAAELAGIGALAGGVMAGVGRAAIALRQRFDPSFQPSTPAPSLYKGAAGLATCMALSSNIRYQLVAGMDRYLFDHSNFLWSYLACSGIVRVFSNHVGQSTRLSLMGLPQEAPLRQSASQSASQQQQQFTQSARPQLPTRAAAAGGPRPKARKRVKVADKGFAMSAGAA